MGNESLHQEVPPSATPPQELGNDRAVRLTTEQHIEKLYELLHSTIEEAKREERVVNIQKIEMVRAKMAEIRKAHKFATPEEETAYAYGFYNSLFELEGITLPS
jgi:hypothetical protein